MLYRISVRLHGGHETSLGQWIQATERHSCSVTISESQTGVVSVQMGVRSQSLEELNRPNI